MDKASWGTIRFESMVKFLAMDDCHGSLHARAMDGLRLFNSGHYFEAHEAFEDAWNQEPGPIRDLYRGILQVSVVYLHLTRRNYRGAIKVYERSKKWLQKWPAACRGVQVDQLRKDVGEVMQRIHPSTPADSLELDVASLKPIQWKDESGKLKQVYTCDRCGSQMVEKNCKIVCHNCGNRFDCSDLNINFD